jgi:aspartyl protease
MRIDGFWLTCDDGVIRPVMPIAVRAASGQFIHAHFLVDTAADHTVPEATLVVKLGLPSQPPPPGLSFQGVGGQTPFVVLTTRLQLLTTDGVIVAFSGQFAAFTDPKATDISLLGRDYLNQFDVIVSRRRDEVMLLGGHHAYTVN